MNCFADNLVLTYIIYRIKGLMNMKMVLLKNAEASMRSPLN